ncbi:hypothetical protein [Nannocystis exedens]|uniref:hypothetical protein n=1 Tax=Nannocystis exedens TaxID=54 RepID=UPI0011603002|nr:hypothetical protein [Nannocystis exedens]
MLRRTALRTRRESAPPSRAEDASPCPPRVAAVATDLCRARRAPGSRSALGSAALALIAALACGHGAPSGPAVAAGPDTTSPSGHAPPASSPAPAGGVSQPRAEAITKKIMEAVSAARNLPITGGVAVEVLTRGDVRSFAEKSMYEHHSRDEIRLFTRIEASLGVLPPGADGEQILLDMLELGVMGIYEPKKKAMLIGTHVSEAQLDMVVGHEIAHGLQDMHFDLLRLQKPIPGDSDAETARTFLVEGDAQAAYLAWVSGPSGLAAIPPEVLATVGDQALSLSSMLDHPILNRSLQLPYADGAATVAALVREKGWAAVDALYRDLPTTSEQMLHVDKLLAREPAIAVKAEPKALAAALPEHALVWQDTLGEATLLCMLADSVPTSDARAAAAGWGGDRLLVFDRKAGPDVTPLVIGMVAWDSEADAREFEAAFTKYLMEKMPTTSLVRRRADRVLFATGVPQGLGGALDPAAWNAFPPALRAKGQAS